MNQNYFSRQSKPKVQYRVKQQSSEENESQNQQKQYQNQNGQTNSKSQYRKKPSQEQHRAPYTKPQYQYKAKNQEESFENDFENEINNTQNQKEQKKVVYVKKQEQQEDIDQQQEQQNTSKYVKKQYQQQVPKYQKKKNDDNYNPNTQNYQNNSSQNQAYRSKQQSQNTSKYSQQQQQQQQKGGRLKKENNRQKYNLQEQRNNRRQQQIVFKEHLNEKQAMKGVEEKTLFKGVFLANEVSRNYGQIRSEDFEYKVFVNSKEDQNRALHGQTVIFRLKTDEEIEELKEKKLLNMEEHKKFVEQQKYMQIMKQTGQKVFYKPKVEKQENTNDNQSQNKDEEWGAVKKIDHQIGEIVYIEPYEIYSKLIVGKISVNIRGDDIEADTVEYQLKQQENTNEENNNDLENIDQQENQINNRKKNIENDKDKQEKLGPMGYWFTPLNKKLPKMFIKQCLNKEIREMKLESLQSQYFAGQIMQWNKSTFHPDFEIIESIGPIGEIEVECKALLKEHQVEEKDWSEETQKYIKEELETLLNENDEYIIPKEEKEQRWDLTNEIICTIDPETARDLDDALSIKKIEDNVYEVGVHIADVSHFVKEGSPLEEEAKMRTTSVYLVHRVIPMLPRILSENLCSLNGNVERLAFSTIFYMNEDGEVIREKETKFGKSVIKSCAKMSYESAQSIIDGTYKSVEEVPDHILPNKEVDHQQWFENIKFLNKIAQKRRQNRMDNGAIMLVEREKKTYTLDEKNWPINYSIYERKDAHFMVEEYMILANQLTAQKVVDTDRELAVLRKHEPPTSDKQEEFSKFLEQFSDHNINFDTTSNAALKESIEQLRSSTVIPQNILKIINYNLVKLVEQAKYILTENSNQNSWRHFALSLDVYTHFTSPIRRYPDILSHRLLFKALKHQQQMKEHVNKQDIKQILGLCNEMKTNSKRVSDGCEKIFMCLYLKSNKVDVNGIVLGFGDKSIRVLIPEYDILNTIQLNDIKGVTDIKTQENKSALKQIIISYDTKDENNEQQKGQIIFEPFQDIKIQLTSTNKFPVDYKCSILCQDPKQKGRTFLLQ